MKNSTSARRWTVVRRFGRSCSPRAPAWSPRSGRSTHGRAKPPRPVWPIRWAAFPGRKQRISPCESASIAWRRGRRSRSRQSTPAAHRCPPKFASTSSFRAWSAARSASGCNGSAGPWSPVAKTSFAPSPIGSKGATITRCGPSRSRWSSRPASSPRPSGCFRRLTRVGPRKAAIATSARWWERGCGFGRGRTSRSARPPSASKTVARRPHESPRTAWSFSWATTATRPCGLRNRGRIGSSFAIGKGCAAAATTAGKSAVPDAPPTVSIERPTSNLSLAPGPWRRCESRPRTTWRCGGSPWCSPVRIGPISRWLKCRCTRVPPVRRRSPSAGCRRTPGRRSRGRSIIAGTFLRWNCRRGAMSISSWSPAITWAKAARANRGSCSFSREKSFSSASRPARS